MRDRHRRNRLRTGGRREIRERRVLDAHVERLDVAGVEDADGAAETGELRIPHRQVERLRSIARAAQPDLSVETTRRIVVGEHRIRDGQVVDAVARIGRFEHLDVRAGGIAQVEPRHIEVEHAVGRAAMLNLDRIAVVHLTDHARVQHGCVGNACVHDRAVAASQEHQTVRREIARR